MSFPIGSTREPFLDILRKALRWGGFAGLAVYAYAIMTDNPNLYLSSNKTKKELELMEIGELRDYYESILRKGSAS